MEMPFMPSCAGADGNGRRAGQRRRTLKGWFQELPRRSKMVGAAQLSPACRLAGQSSQSDLHQHQYAPSTAYSQYQIQITRILSVYIKRVDHVGLSNPIQSPYKLFVTRENDASVPDSRSCVERHAVIVGLSPIPYPQSLPSSSSSPFSVACS